MTVQEFQQITYSIPGEPGIYKYFDQNNELLYVGKAKNIRKRVSSYFTKTTTNYKTQELVRRIYRIECTIVNSEQDAFLLENALIKQSKPKFNINLKDDKTYPYIIIKKEPFPRVFLTRQKANDGSEYIGPFTSVLQIRELLTFIKAYVPLRTCTLSLTEKNIQKKRFNVCLEYHLGNCKGPCEGLQNEEEYAEGLQYIRNIVKGNLSPIIQYYKAQMKQQVALLEFEQAELYRKKIDYLEKYQARSVVVNTHLGNVDVFSILKEEKAAYVNYLMVQNGTIVQTHTTSFDLPLDESEQEILPIIITQLRLTFNRISKEIIIPFSIKYPQQEVRITVPKAGDKKRLLDLSIKNATYFKQEVRRKKALQLSTTSNNEKIKILQMIQDDLQLPALPIHIECFDNSNFQGSYPVSAMVCFKNGIPSKKDYRHFHIKTVKGIDDFATMKEVVYRRYKRLMEEQQSFPQLIIIDGGKGQLSAAVATLKSLGAFGITTVIGLAKKEEKIFFPDDTDPIQLDWSRESLKLIRGIRDEVHRFGINFHRNQRSKGTFKNELETIKGIGKSTVEALLKKYKSVQNIRALSKEELSNIVGEANANRIIHHFK